MSDILDDARDDLRSPDPTVREKEAIEALQGLSEDPDAFVRDFAVESLSSIVTARDPVGGDPITAEHYMFPAIANSAMRRIMNGRTHWSARAPFLVLDYTIWSSGTAMPAVIDYCRRNGLRILLPDAAFYELGRKARDYQSLLFAAAGAKEGDAVACARASPCRHAAPGP